MQMHDDHDETTTRIEFDDPRAGLEGALYELKRVIVGQDAMLERVGGMKPASAPARIAA